MPAGMPPKGVSGGPDVSAERARALGSAVAVARENAGLSIEQVAEATRIRATLIRAVEAGDFAPCGGHVYARGHLRAIAAVLDVDGAAFLADYDELSGQTDTAVRKAPAGDRIESEPMALGGLRGEHRRPASGWLIAAVAAAAVLAGGIGLSVFRGGDGGSPSALDISPSTSVTTGPSRPGSESPRPSVSQTVAFAGVNVVVNVTGSASWIHAVDENGTLVFQGTLAAGQTKELHGAQQLKFVFGNAPAVSLVVNGKSIGQPPANSSQVANVTIDANTATTGQLG
jgi:cytoskeleton protein RodZ